MFRRDSKYVGDICKVLAEKYDLDVPGRRLEDYSRAGLLLPRSASPEQQAEHIVSADLTRTFRPGLRQAADKATFAAAASGSAPEGYAAALGRLWSGTAARHADHPDPEIDEGNRAIGDELRAMVRWADEGAPETTPEITQLVRGLLAGARQSFVAKPLTDPYVKKADGKAVEETPDQSISSALETAANMFYGGTAPAQPESLAAVEHFAGVPPTDAPAQEYIGAADAADLLSDVAEKVPADEAVTEALTAKVETLVEGAVWLRQFLDRAPLVLGGAELTSEQLDVLAGQLAPIGAAMRSSGFVEAIEATFEELGIEAQRYLPPAGGDGPPPVTPA